jgi:polysaccharide export outer membrane protein
MNATMALAITLLLASPVWGEWHTYDHVIHASQSATSSAPVSSSSASATVSGSASARSAPAAGAVSVPPAVSADLGSPFTPGPDYVIGLGDVLRISVWKEPEFSSTVQVRSDGKISLPLLNDILAVGFKPMDLATSLTERLKKYVDDPRVTIIVSQARPPVFYMVGEVGHHGPMALAPNMTVFQAVMTAGLGTFANSKKIYVLRVENGVERRIPVNYKRLVKGKSLNQNILLKPGDVVVVP